MTVAAVVLAATPASALADADGTPGIRRIVDAAWAGGATPIVVVSFDPDGAVARALANAEVTLADPVPVERGPVGQIVHGIEVAAGLVAETDAAFVWPARMAWADAETITTLIAVHGRDRAAMLRPTFGGEVGWPVLVPLVHLGALRAVARDLMPPEVFEALVAAGVPARDLETGDPGTTHDVSVPRAELPAFDGPPEPADAHAHEWGAAAADDPDDAPVPGPARAPAREA